MCRDHINSFHWHTMTTAAMVASSNLNRCGNSSCGRQTGNSCSVRMWWWAVVSNRRCCDWRRLWSRFVVDVVEVLNLKLFVDFSGVVLMAWSRPPFF